MRVLTVLLLTAVLRAAEVDSATLDRIATEELSKQKIPGMSVALVKGDRVVYARGFGVASLETNTPVMPNTLFRIGSLTKTFVAVAVVELSQQGHLRLDAPIDNYIYGLNPEIGRLTAHQLLSHTAGLSDEVHYRGPHEETALAMTAQSLYVSVLFTRPGQVFSYSNLGYVLLGRLIEVIKGKPFADAMDELVFQPLGMNRTTFRPTTAMTYPLSPGHSDNGKVSRPDVDHAGYWPAGFLFASGNDLARFMIAFVNNGALEGKHVLSPSLITSMSRPNLRIPGMAERYGYGLFVDDSGGARVISHGGNIPACCRSALIMVPESKVGIAAIINRSGDASPEAVARRILERVLTAKPAHQTAAPSSASPGQFAGKYVQGSGFFWIDVAGGKLIARDLGTESGKTQQLESAGGDCYNGGTSTVCFWQDYAFVGGRAFRKQ
jgi:CubicO group peptidase (beta-lactamase class C family)